MPYSRAVIYAVVSFLVAGPFMVSRANADNLCDQFGREFAMLQDEHNLAVQEFNRVQAMDPKPTKDIALCHALRIFLNDNIYFVTLDSSHQRCFDSEQAANDFSNGVHQWGDGAATLIGLFCSEEELHQPITSKVDECVPNC